jgi:RNA polymerase sigma factor (sigma-70 family)
MRTQEPKICDETFPADGILWNQLRDSNKCGLEKIYLKYSQELFLFGMAIKPNRSFVKDCMQELFIDLWKYRRGLTQTDNVKIYLLKSLSNRMRKGIMEDQKKFVDLELSGYEVDFVEESVEDRFIETQRNESLHKKLMRTLERLPVRQREVIQLLFFEKLSYEDISRILGISIDSSYTLVWKAINSMRKESWQRFY